MRLFKIPILLLLCIVSTVPICEARLFRRCINDINEAKKIHYSPYGTNIFYCKKSGKGPYSDRKTAIKRKSRILQKLEKNNETEEHDGKTGSRILQFIAGLSASLSVAATAANSAWTSPALPYLKRNESKFPVTDEQGAWIISIYNFSDIVGTLLIMFLIDRIGRKFSLLLSGLPSLIAWFFIIFADNYIYLLIARFFAGLGQGCVFSTIVIYLSEIAEKNVRNTLVNNMRILSVMTTFILTAVGSFLSYETLTLSCITVPILFLLTFMFMPESPYYFLMKGRDEDAIKCLRKLRGLTNPQILIPVVREMKFDIEEMRNLKINSFKELFVKSYNRKGLLIVLCMKVTQLMSGQAAILNYTEEIFKISGSSLESKVSVLILAGVRVVSSFISSEMIDRISKRMNFLVSGILAASFLAIVGLFFFLKYYIEANVSSISWLPLAALILFEVVYYSGISFVPYVIQGEIFSINVKGTAVAGGMIMGSVCSFVSTSGYYALSNAAGVYTAFWFFALVAIFGSIVSFLIIPETDGKTLEEIQAMQNPEMRIKLDLQRSTRAEVKNSV